MQLRKLKDCDASDMAIWANSTEAKNFFGNIGQQHDIALERLIKDGTQENAATVRAYKYVLTLWKDTKI